MPLGELYANFDAIMGSAYSVCLFTNWQNGQVDKAYIKHKVDGKKSINPGASLFGASITSSNERGPDDYDRWISTPCGVVGPWHEHLPHFELKNPTAKGLELQTEYFVPRERAVDALRAVESIHELLAPLIDVTEIRTIAADHLWMSPSYRQDTVGIHFGWRHKGPEVAALLPVLESHLEPFDARPHWGKLFATTPARLRALYERLPDFEELLSAFDPRGKFRNNFLDNRLLGV